MADEENTQQQGAVLTFETLYDYTQRERNETPLQSLSDSFLDDVYSYLKERRAFIEKTKKKADVFGQNQILNMEKQFANAIRLLRYLLENREKKIIDMALHSVRSHADASDENAMLPHERQLYSAVFTIMSHFQGTVLESLLRAVYDESKTFSRTTAQETLADFCKQLGISGDAGFESYEEKALPDNPIEPAMEDEDKVLEELDPSKAKAEEDTSTVSDTKASEQEPQTGKQGKAEGKDTDYTFRDELEGKETIEESNAAYADPKSGSQADSSSDEQTESEKQEETKKEEAADMTPVNVKIIADVDKFIGLDLEVYGPYSEGETVEVPESIARLLVGKEYAVRE
jgi:DNA replication initiation complex subunit (GINS family)